uniref:Cytochrome c oxidase subunit NDUFA4-like n=1 Tax=Scophthalmus maximus TaxID=52904 RepID=A0A8D3E0M4_SCOMX
MSAGRSGAGQSQTRAAAPGPQPLKATVPYQLASKPRSHRRVGKSAGKDKLHQLSSGMRRTVSLDAIIGPYLQGHWPKEPEGQSSKDKSTQTQSTPIPLAPLSTLVPRLRCSVEGLNQELEGMFICQPLHPQHRLLEIPDGHRAPVPPQSCSSGSQSDPATTPLSSSSSSPCSSPNYISISLPNSQDVPVDLHQGLTDSAEMCLLSPFSTQNEADLSLPLLISSSPGPNKSCCFQREPPEGCEKVRVWEETSTPRQSKPTLLSSCPDPNKLIPLFIFIGGGVTMSATYLARLALKNPDVSWDRTNNPEPWNKLEHNQQYKLFAINMDYSKLKKDRPDF